MGDTTPDPSDVIPVCVICGGRMEVVYDRPNTKVCVCIDCHSGLTVPTSAWGIARLKREETMQTGPAPDRR